MYDVAIIGAGAGGITTAIYASRAGLKVALIERGIYGGQLYNTDVVENYTGFTTVDSEELAESMEEHVKAQDNIDHIYADIEEIKQDNGKFYLVDSMFSKYIVAKTIVIATGVKHKKLGIEGEDTYDGKGVSYCAVCDGAFFKGKDVAVIGGGDSAVESAIYLANIVNKVTLVHRRGDLRAEKVLQERLFSLDNVEVRWDCQSKMLFGDEDKLKYLEVWDSANLGISIMNIDGAFIYIGMEPVTEPFENLGVLDESGFVVTDSRMNTSVDGVFAIGDVRLDSIRQVVTATGDGAVASESVIKYLQETQL